MSLISETHSICKRLVPAEVVNSLTGKNCQIQPWSQSQAFQISTFIMLSSAAGSQWRVFTPAYSRKQQRHKKRLVCLRAWLIVRTSVKGFLCHCPTCQAEWEGVLRGAKMWEHTCWAGPSKPSFSPTINLCCSENSFCCHGAVGGYMFEVSQVSVFITFSARMANER